MNYSTYLNSLSSHHYSLFLSHIHPTITSPTLFELTLHFASIHHPHLTITN